MKKDSKRGSALISAIKSESVVDLSKEYAEYGLDMLIDSDVLKDIPFINTAVGVFSAVGSARDYIFTEKLIRFLSTFSDLSKSERVAMVDKLNEDYKFSGKAGAKIIEIIDRIESEDKPELAAKFFKAFASEEIDFSEFRRVLVALERIPAFDIPALAAFSMCDIYESVRMEQSLLLAFVNAGLGQNNGGLDGGAILPTELCEIFVRAGKLKTD
ncbi:TPA: hypothetical protein L7V13_000654 [Klebsiella quasipneumoniae subsp. quasipneumoniae]|nr:hypothetical protein [Klebsiella quasipneumoniae subsp. quasipneumoniae]HBT4817157.1 hypothetical protein [Klebsiella quasipneumoniae subsp. quasipneumoniae]HCC2627104.1 hypothetical protein [Klebsiella quasipneumoniae]HCI6169171.1 hypothetical protein [Klebsiella quasipneumoniae subsp. quasipneumoniae]HDK5911770.1 hypothetical protein [Klebsiella quasipneumoniae]